MSDLLISRYRILEPLGVGGMGEVYLAEDTSLGRRVAIKFLPQEYTKDEERLRRFKREAKAASTLNHPNILTIHEVGVADDRHFIVTEFVDGESLRARLERGSLTTYEAVRVASQVASALIAAHQAGIVHRDIKPENIILRTDGYAKVVDFGLAKLTSQRSPSLAGLSTDSGLTQAGMVLGTLHYMAPEQATGMPVDERSDTFALGAVLYEMLAGRRAFDGTTPMEIIAAVVTREPPPLPRTVPRELANVVARSLNKDPHHRFQSAAALKTALDDVGDALSSGDRRRRTIWRAAAAALLLAVGAIAAVATWRATRGAESTPALTAVPLTALPGIVRYPSFSPDAEHVVFSWTGGEHGNPAIFVQQIGSASPLRLTTGSVTDFNPVWSPDGRTIAFLRRQPDDATRSEVRLIAPLGGSERRLSDIRVSGGLSVTPPYIAWCPDSDCLVVTDSPGEGQPDALFVLSLETGEKRQLTHPHPPVNGDAHPALSPDGRWLVFRRMSGLFVGELYRLRLERGVVARGEPQRVTVPQMDAQHPAWLPDSRTILYSAQGNLWKQRVTGAAGEPARLPFVGEYGQMPIISRSQADGLSRLVYVRSFDDFNIWRVRTSHAGAPPDSPPAVAISSTRRESMPQLSPDGHRVAFTSDRSGHWEIWVADTDGTNAVAVTSMGAVAAGYPHWSPDGQSLVFHSNLEGQWDVYIVPAAGGKARRLTTDPGADDFPSFSRDGRWVYFSSDRSGGPQQSIWKVPTSGGEPTLVAGGSGYCPQEGPDGALYYVEGVDGPSALKRIVPSGGAAERVADSVYLGNFAVLDSGIYLLDRPAGRGRSHYVDLPLGETRLRYLDLASRRVTTVVRDIGTVDVPLTSSRDGLLMFYARLDASINDLMLVEKFR